jgi:hypothetical protein
MIIPILGGSVSLLAVIKILHDLGVLQLARAYVRQSFVNAAKRRDGQDDNGNV